MQVLERAFFGVPFGAPFSSVEANKVADTMKKELRKDGADVSSGMVITERSAIRFTLDYGLMPHLVTKPEARALFKSLNRSKRISTDKVQDLDTKNAIRKQSGLGAAVLPGQHSSSKKPGGFKMSTSHSPMKRTKDRVKVTNPAPAILGGLSFTEFVEFIGKVAMQGLRTTEYERMFPTPFLKYQAILTVFGVADMDKLASVRTMHADSVDELEKK